MQYVSKTQKFYPSHFYIQNCVVCFSNTLYQYDAAVIKLAIHYVL